jgi:hypothetical protein
MKISYSENFLKESKKLSKKFKRIKYDLQEACIDIIENNNLGVSLGLDIYKKRVKNSSIPTGKSGGFRVIIYKKIDDEIVLLSIYSKTHKESLSDEELKDILATYLSK